MRAGIWTRRESRRALAAGSAAGALAMVMSVIPASAHVYVTEGSTSASPTSGPRGTNITVSASGAGVEGGSSYGLLWADASYVKSFQESPSESGHGTGESNICGHGQPIAGPFTPNNDGAIGPVEIEVPFWSSAGRSLVCFSNGARVTEPVAFDVTGAADGGGGDGGGFEEFCGPFADFCSSPFPFPLFPSAHTDG